MRWSIFHFRSNRSSCMWQLIWVFAGEAPCGAKSQESGVGGQTGRTRRTHQVSALGSINFVTTLGWVTVAVAAVAARICPFVFAVTV